MAHKQLTKPELRERWGESDKQIERYVKEGLPCAGSGRARRFPWPEVQRWRDERLKRIGREEAERNLTPRSGFAGSRARKMEADAQMAEMQLSEKRGELLSVEYVEAQLERAFQVVRARILNLPARAGPYMVGCKTVAEVQVRTKDLVDELLAGLSELGESNDLDVDDEPPPPSNNPMPCRTH